ncbi:hypothetical protein V6N12_005735, partial [Hibiscus sabdariffa]
MALGSHRTSFLVELEAALKKELDEVLAQEESLWHQKSRKDGSWCSDEAALKNSTVEFFSKLFISEPRQETRVEFNGGFANLSAAQSSHLTRPVTLEE